MTNTGRARQRSMPGVVDDCNKLRMTNLKVSIMLGWALTFLVIALIAALLGFGVIAGGVRKRV